MKESFKDKFLDVIKDIRVIILFLIIILSIFGINYSFFNSQGIVIDSIAQGSIAQKSGVNFDSHTSLTSYEEIISINGEDIKTPDEFYKITDNSQTINLITNLNPEGYILTKSQNESNFGISVRKKPTSNLHLGIEFEGGSRFILKPEERLSELDYTLLKDSLQSRLDIYGVSGTKVEKLKDAFSDEQLIIVESTSSNKNDILELIHRQGNFKAVLNNITIFTGDDVLTVSQDPRSSRFGGCKEDEENLWTCHHSLSFSVNQEAAQRFYDVSQNLTVTDGHLSEDIHYFLDGVEIINLSVSSIFKYKKIFNQQITFPGNPSESKDIAMESLNKEKKFLVTVLSTKSLPSKLDIVQSYSISSSMGSEFLHNAILVGLLALLVVAGTIAIRYRYFSIFVGIVFALISEIIILLGIAVFMRISIDLAAIGGIIAAIGTGVDDQVIITDEQLRKKNRNLTSKKRLKAALLIILISYITTLAAMFPLMFGGLSMLKGFAFMVIIGVTIGVFVTRPAYAKFLRIMLTTREERKEESEKDE
jgi:preprotein translocase subunit SecD